MTTEKTILKVVLGVFVILILALGTILVTAIVKNDAATDTETTTTTETATQSTMISEQQAITIASSVGKGTLAEVELTEKNGKQVYAVEFEDGETEIDVSIDPTTGTIIKVEEETELGKKDLEVIQATITEDQAKGIAIQSVPGTVVEVETVKVNNKYVYEIEVQQNGNEVDVVIDMMTGAILDIEVETADEDDDKDDDEREEEDKDEIPHAPSMPSEITRAQAESIAVAKVGGTVTDFEDKGDAFEVEIQKGGDEIDVLVDKKTGAVVGIERD